VLSFLVAVQREEVVPGGHDVDAGFLGGDRVADLAVVGVLSVDP
jgi:hypothetical protein